MSPLASRVCVGSAFVLLSLGAWLCQRRGDEKTVVATRAPSPAAEMIVAGLGGFRGLAAEVIWFRADRLQDEGRYAELAQLSAWLTFLEPHTPEVWAYAAWNLSYNISVSMPTPQDRWRWVEAGISLLRDKGLVLNPGCPDLCRDLAWLFQLKIAADVDSASATYRTIWRRTVEDVKARGAWDELRMNPIRMLEIERVTGFDDWGDPCLSAIYWAREGLERARGNVRENLAAIIRQSQVMYRRAHQSV